MPIILYGVALFSGAFLLFWLQPLVARLLLPVLGGVPAVWTGVMLFFQGALLLGYLWAHLLSGRPRKIQAAAHGVLLAVAAFSSLPVRLDPGLAPPADGGGVLWLLAVLAISVGPAAVAGAATAPLLQGWFHLGGHAQSSDPYFLYAASNVGSLAALLAYPLLVEPLSSLGSQGSAWGAGFVFLTFLTLAGGLLSGNQAAILPGPPLSAAGSKPLSGRLQARWVLLAAAPSSLLLGVTTHLTTDIAAVPLLWIVPLALYLLTYVMAFSRRTLIPAPLLSRTQAVAVASLALVFAAAVSRVEKSALLLPLHLLAFFLTSLVCHRELAAFRPEPRHLTRFYLAISVGGVLGGLFNALIAPAVFRTLAEYPLVLVAACLLRPARGDKSGFRWPDWAWPALLGVALAAAGYLVRSDTPLRWLLLAGGAAVCLVWSGRPLRFALALAALVTVGKVTHQPLGTTLAAGRNFFGPVRVIGDAGARILQHGRTVHGAQLTDERRRRTPLAYYTPAGPAGDIFRILASGAEARIAVIGLGSGALAAYGREGQSIDFHEINPLVAAMALEPRLFTYLSDSPATISVRLGDGRRGLAAEEGDSYALIVVDAFNSDAVPVHLLTREALALYLSRLAPGGALAFNLTNDYLDLEPVVARVAADLGLVALARSDDEKGESGDVPFRLPSDWLVTARSATDLRNLPAQPGWHPARLKSGTRPWTDNHAALLGAINWGTP